MLFYCARLLGVVRCTPLWFVMFWLHIWYWWEFQTYSLVIQRNFVVWWRMTPPTNGTVAFMAWISSPIQTTDKEYPLQSWVCRRATHTSRPCLNISKHVYTSVILGPGIVFPNGPACFCRYDSSSYPWMSQYFWQVKQLLLWQVSLARFQGATLICYFLAPSIFCIIVNGQGSLQVV